MGMRCILRFLPSPHLACLWWFHAYPLVVYVGSIGARLVLFTG